MSRNIEDAERDGFDFDQAAETCGLSDMQRAFARAILRGANRTQAARQAGYGGTDDQLRSAGYKAYNSPKVQAFLALAKREGFGLPDEPGDAEELKRLLWRHARGDDKNHAIRAAEVLHRIEKEEAATAKDATAHSNPVEVLKKVAAIDPLYAAKLAKAYNIDWTPQELANAERCPTCQQVIPARA